MSKSVVATRAEKGYKVTMTTTTKTKAPAEKAPAKRGRKPGPMSEEHKAALAAGRDEGRAVKAYLEGLEAARPKRGRKRSPDTLKARIEAINMQIEEASPLKRVQLTQERLDAEAALAELEDEESVDIESLEKDFIKVAKTYSQRKGISYSAWREIGVPASVLRQANISRGD